MFYGILIRMFFNDHAPPHFHARYGEFEATIDIGTSAVLQGQLPSRALNLVQEWAMIHREELFEDWRLCRDKERPNKVECNNWSVQMYWDVVEVKPEPHYCLFVRFKDGQAGRVHLREDDLTGVLAPLRDVQCFEQVFIDCGAVAWPGEIDLAPDAMYSQIVGKRPELLQTG